MRRVAPLLLLCLALAGCGLIGDLASLQARLTDAGYTNVSTDHSSINGTDRLEVTASSDDPAKTVEQIAEIVWDSYPQHVDQVSIALNETYEVYTADALREAFGERLVAEKPDDDADVGRTIVTWLIVAAVVFLLFVAGLVVLIVFLVRRSNRRRAQQQPYYPPPPPGWPPAA
ncbi:hypothetical protein ACFOWZ_39545 [Lentzea rhizosphaerae]|uniref:Lipoprotein n=1 Tax=Lentzea rhizosphaerae TaxID=2041025 RepID=A0ABV8C6H2_9PSEU